MVSDWISINWFKHHRRSEELGRALGAETHFIVSERNPLALRYLDQWCDTRKLLSARKPRVVQIMQPPAVALACVATSRRLRSSILIGDLHTGVFSDPRWRWASVLVLWTLRRRGFAIVPNEELAEICRQAGVETYVSHGFISATSAKDEQHPDGHILVPLAYAFDEPIHAILGAALRLPHRHFVLTGRAPSAIRKSAPGNVTFPGFVSKDEFMRLRVEAGAVLALTDQERTMQSAGYEALADSTPLVTSPRRVLIDFFGDSAVYAESDSESIAEAIETVFAQHDLFSQQMAKRRQQQARDQTAAIEVIQATITAFVDQRGFR